MADVTGMRASTVIRAAEEAEGALTLVRRDRERTADKVRKDQLYQVELTLRSAIGQLINIDAG